LKIFYKPRKVNKYLVVYSRIAAVVTGMFAWNVSRDVLATGLFIPLTLIIFDEIIEYTDNYLVSRDSSS